MLDVIHSRRNSYRRRPKILDNLRGTPTHVAPTSKFFSKAYTKYNLINYLTIGIFCMSDVNGNDNAINEEFDWLSEVK